jgi:hypothetical protein
VYTVFAPYAPCHCFLHFLPPPTVSILQSPGRACFILLTPDFVKEKKWHFVYLRWLHRIFLVTFPCIYVLLLELVHLHFPTFYLCR